MKNLNLKSKGQKFLPIILAGFLFALLSLTIFGQRRERLIEAWQPLRFDVKLVFDNELSSLSAATADVEVLIRQNEVTKIDFDFGTMPVNGVKINGETAKFAQYDRKLDVFFTQPAQKNQKLNISVSYSGKPQDGLILTKDRDGFPSAVGDNWGDRVHNWIPCLDHPAAKASVKFTVTAPAKNTVVANGVMENATVNADGTKTWTWNEAKVVSPYNMVVVVGNFANATLKTKSPAPISYYVPQSDRQFAEQGFSSAFASVQTFEKLVAPYPYQKLALIVGATRFGGMENANTIVFTPNIFANFADAKPRSLRYNIPSGVNEVVAHEIAHQWFGNTVTQATWADLWLSEGFATYFAGVFLEQNEGNAAFRGYMKTKAQSYLRYEKRRRAPIHDTKTEKLFDLLNPNNYEKGAWVLHVLRGTLGDKDFFDGIKIYYRKHLDSTATTEDLRAAFERASGKDLKPFFKRWIYEAGHPVYKVSWKEAGKKSIEITLEQTQEDAHFPNPVTLEIVGKKAKKRVTITPDGKSTKLKIKSEKPEKITVDPDDFILKSLSE